MEETEKVEAPPPIICIEDVEKTNIVVREVENELRIYYGSSIKYAFSKNKYRSLLFSRCQSSRMYLYAKTLKITFERCNKCDVRVAKNIIGVLDFFECRKCKLSQEAEVPIFQIGHSEDIQFFLTQNSPQKYAVSTSYGVEAISPFGRRNISNMFDNQRTFVYLNELEIEILDIEKPPRKRPESPSCGKKIPILRSGLFAL